MPIVVFPLYVRKEYQPILEKAKEVAKREGKPLSELIFTLLQDYIKKHGSGNPSFEITKWVEKPDFKAYPTLGETPNADKLMREDPETIKDLYARLDQWKWVVWQVAKRRGIEV